MQRPPLIRLLRSHLLPQGEKVCLGAVLVLLGACQTGSGARDYAEFRSPEDPTAVAARIADNVRACWFGGARPAFASYSYTPELASYSNRPRVLIVEKSNPTGLPRLVIEASASENGTSIKLFGPLLASAEGPAIGRDLARWAGGAGGC